MFADEIVPQSSYVNQMVKCSESYKNLAGIISRSNLSRFDSEEYRGIVGESPQSTIKKIEREFLSRDSFNSIISARAKLRIIKPERSIPASPYKAFAENDRMPSDDGSKTDAEKLSSEQNANAAHETPAPSLEKNPKVYEAMIATVEFNTVTNTLLNMLEHFCMALNSEVADDEILYPSLHQVFFSIVSLLYVYICSANNGNATDKYYTHVIALYNKWDAKHQADIKLLKDVEQEINTKYEQKKRGQLH